MDIDFDLYSDSGQHELITAILLQIAAEKNKSLRKIKRLLFLKQDTALNKRFWETVDNLLPFHPFVAVKHCMECGALEFMEEANVATNTEENHHKANFIVKQ